MTQSAKEEILSAYRAGKLTEAQCWEQLRSIRSPKKGEIVLTEPPSKTYENLNASEIEALLFLAQHVSFGAASSAKRFVRQMQGAMQMTSRQREYLRQLVYKYRRQIWSKASADHQAKAFCEKMAARETIPV